MLHTVNKAPFQSNCLGSCLRLAQKGDAILLIEDGVYAASAEQSEAIEGIQFYALEADVQARGLGSKLASHIELIDHRGFVKLTEQHSLIQSWF